VLQRSAYERDVKLARAGKALTVLHTMNLNLKGFAGDRARQETGLDDAPLLVLYCPANAGSTQPLGGIPNSALVCLSGSGHLCDDAGPGPELLRTVGTHRLCLSVCLSVCLCLCLSVSLT
jgi:hypothetical protein